MKIPFYILGLLLRYGPQHGYKLKQIIEERISDFAKIKLPTLYYHLEKLKEKGLVTETTDKDGNRPEKQVFAISERGKVYFRELYKEMLSTSYSSEFLFDGAIYFKEYIGDKELKDELYSKRNTILKKLEYVNNHRNNVMDKIDETGRWSAEVIFDHHIYHLEAELKWIEKAIEGLSK